MTTTSASLNGSSPPLCANPLHQCDWKPEWLSSFTFLMSGHGCPIRASMMLGDAAYARKQLRLACTFDDPVLQQLAVQMLGPLSHAGPPLEATPQWCH